MTYLIKGKTTDWEVVIGLEVHCQINSKAKLFSDASTSFGSNPNSQVSFVDAGYPGVLPSPNQTCIELALKTSIALGGVINKLSYFDRKHYFYPDLPLGYQITQFYTPIMQEGALNINLKNGSTKRIGIERLHIEQDAGKLLHEHHNSKSLIDLNRAGVGLMEIVSKPELSSPLEVAEYLSKLRSIVRYIGSCDGNMEEGSMRCDVNISVKPIGYTGLRNRVEVKNVNSIRFVMQAIEYEANRQVEAWEEDRKVVQETRLFNSNEGVTASMRSKEEATDYRYIRDPDLLPILLEDSYINKVKHSIPELPDAKIKRFKKDYGLNEYDANVLTKEQDISIYFEECFIGDTEIFNPSTLVNIITTNLFSYLKKDNKNIKDITIKPKDLHELVVLIEQKVISSKIAKDIIDIMWVDSSSSPLKIVEERGLKQISNEDDLKKIVLSLIDKNLDKVDQIKSGKDKLLGWFVGEAMKVTAGKANPQIINQLLKENIYK